MKKDWSKLQLWTHNGTYEDFPEGSNNYYAMLAVDTHGSACRDNSLTELISIGKGIEEENNNE
jgi:hypothetical protein